MPARVGLVGNPSDGHGGAVLATVLPAPAAEVVVRPATGLHLGGRSWPSSAAWCEHVETDGFVGEDRLLDAALWTLVDHLGHAVPRDEGLTIEWSSDVPRSVGLAGSSALAVGVIDAVAASWGHRLDRRVVAALALRAEHDVLGVAAGWQDRIVQSFGCTVLVDAATMEAVDGVLVPFVHRLVAPDAGIELLVGWAADVASDSGTYHAPLHARRGELAGPMAELAALARGVASAWEAGDLRAVGEAMDAGWALRQRHVPLRDDHATLVELVHAAGLPATTPGSGGSVVALCTDPVATARAEAALGGRGCATCRVLVR